MRGLITGVAAGYLQLALSILSQFLLVPILLKTAGKELSGVYLILLTIANVAAIGVGWMIAPAQRRMIKDNMPGGGGSAVAHGLLWWSLVGYAIAFGLAAIASCLLVGTVCLSALNPHQVGIVRSCILGLAFFIFFSFAAQADLALLGARLRQAEANLLRAGFPALFLVGLIAFYMSGSSRIDLLMWLNACSALVMCLAIRRRVLGQWWTFQQIPTWEQSRSILRDEGGQYFTFNLLQFSLLYGDIFLIGWILGPAEAATYVVIWRIAEAAVTLLVRIPETAGPYISTLQARGRKEELARFSTGLLSAMFALALSLGLGYAGAGREIAAWWVGSHNTDKTTTEYALAAMLACFLVVNRTNISLHVALGEVRKLLRIMAIEWTGKATLAVFIGSTWGIKGIIVAGIAAHGTAMFFYWASAVSLYRTTRTRSKSNIALPYLVGGLISLAIIISMQTTKMTALKITTACAIPFLGVGGLFLRRLASNRPPDTQ